MERHADSAAVIDPSDSTVTYAQLWDSVSRAAGGLRAAGLRDGDRVVIDLPNSLDWVRSFVGTVLAGGVAVPLDQRGSEQSRSAVVADADPFLVVTPNSPVPSGPPEWHQASPDDLAQMLYTSGTTGEPKGVMIRQRNLAAFGEITRRALQLDTTAPPLRNLVAIPLSHAAGCNAQLLPTLLLGGSVILAESANPTSIMDAVVRHQADTMLAVPALYKLLVQREAERLSSATCFRRLVYGAAPMPKTLVLELHDLLPHVALGNAFGMTEISNMALFLPAALAISHSKSVGFPVPGVEIELRDTDESGVGELYMRGPNMAAGYWRRPDLTEATFGTGWVRSGDVAVTGPDGLVYIRDRMKDIINRGGEKVYALEVEHRLIAHSDVEDAAVLPVADEVMGEKVGAVVVVREGSSLTPEELASHVGEALPRFAVPERIVLRRQPLPRGSSGKVRKEELRLELGWGS